MATSKDIESRKIEAEEERTYSRAVFVENLKDFMAQNDTENVARAQEWERKMDSERQARQLEKQKLVDSYEKQLADARALLEETRRKDFE